MSVDSARVWTSPITSSHSAALSSQPPLVHEQLRRSPAESGSNHPSPRMSTEATLPLPTHYPPEPLYGADGVPLPQGIPTEGPASHPDGPPREYPYTPATHPLPYLPPPSPSALPTSSTMLLTPDGTQVSKLDAPYAPSAAELFNRAKQMSSPPSPGSEENPGGAGANHYPSSSGVPRLPPILQVEKQQVTTSATQLASASRRRNEAHFVCPVPGCGSTFTRRFNLRGHLRSHTEERPYVCEWPGCKKGFARQHDCKRHQALHTAKSQANVCQGCKKTFSRLDALNRHLRSDGGADCRASNPKFAAEQDHRNDQGSSREHNLQ
ncbi:hypothetical protein BDQ12DRAFT_672890 [Crucibulum laeve]|uniref:C2H2-type domain-containing protein n=1 Tax=Crucibulum laeve TaxID=68775 RepID=A0A5C3MHI8_9AGAR|nr:hypothetical protein BDQ12DRAFT_672890 [Crucibulum laeve]